jgi:hypothetical protein
MRYEIDFNKIKKVVTLPVPTEPLVEVETKVSEMGDKITTTTEYERLETIDGTKYEMINKMLDTILHTEVNMGTNHDIEQMLSSAHFGFRIAFETLESMGIIKYVED